MSIISKIRKQVAVYWGIESAYDSYGQPQYIAPVEISCRWEDISEEYINNEGTTEISKSIVYVGQDVELGGFLLLSALTDVTDEALPYNNVGAGEIKRFDKIPNFKATELLRMAYL